MKKPEKSLEDRDKIDALTDICVSVEVCRTMILSFAEDEPKDERRFIGVLDLLENIRGLAKNLMERDI